MDLLLLDDRPAGFPKSHQLPLPSPAANDAAAMAEPEVSSAAAAGGGKLRNAFGCVLCAFTRLLIGVLACSIRLFSVRSVLLPSLEIQFRACIALSEPHVFMICAFWMSGNQVRERDPRVLQFPRHSGLIAGACFECFQIESSTMFCRFWFSVVEVLGFVIGCHVLYGRFSSGFCGASDCCTEFYVSHLSYPPLSLFLSNNGIYEFWNWFDDRTW
jgi:hypothetical protein